MKRFISNQEIRKELGCNTKRATEIIRFCNDIAKSKGWYELGRGKTYYAIYDKYLGGEKL
ncbi:hypothetical protein [Streptobacillus moniliformis]|uniref:hypothetical protein n=1 Tax=Streptobacillus moniliformis TaxID=34105 RepID=UPI0007E43198|nr:hypothetical protein [Streptobacillus moniliformis]